MKLTWRAGYVWWSTLIRQHPHLVLGQWGIGIFYTTLHFVINCNQCGVSGCFFINVCSSFTSFPLYWTFGPTANGWAPAAHTSFGFKAHILKPSPGAGRRSTEQAGDKMWLTTCRTEKSEASYRPSVRDTNCRVQCSVAPQHVLGAVGKPLLFFSFF